MTRHSRPFQRLMRCLALIASGGVAFQAGGCLSDLTTVTLQNTLLTYLADATRIFFYNLFNL